MTLSTAAKTQSGCESAFNQLRMNENVGSATAKHLKITRLVQKA